MIILGIESSCDETAVALVENGRRILSSEIRSQIEEHKIYGGVVPELASRCHVEALHPLLNSALENAGLSYTDVDAIAVTCGPGLQGALLVGVTAAETLAWLIDRPLIGVNHLEGHIYANFLSFPDQIEFPLLVLLVSGGHTQLLQMDGHGMYQVLGGTRDDAIGEAFDKVARLLGLPYPGGPVIDQLAQSGNPEAFPFPRSMLQEQDFSFSGLKTAVLYTVRKLEQNKQELPIADLCASFQSAAIDTLLEKTLRLIETKNIKQLSVTGGVSANSLLRSRLKTASQAQNFQVFMPPLQLCTDNAAMIAACAWYQWQKKPEDMRFKLQTRPRYPLSQI
ncbi:tRNA (adenosine(37)-N6)-threonylcarbamoyltransferase complex transferase subunit TsaD [bacterium (Candidatus Blackallbacteria) CG17_big_fil_post_rev_8_21_14_2_50_48_46]|uniref:tRNA N6-adenosine threonylcarbamoyltransferase n=1 Tax=bacterium (Candidatus Blackallbacteria) CG17_big_fil_post_rev_8_21_14_2_50_48_46 TaxID=2014261 RepID=A0A2M7G3V8_9BACT|nr:MAG: tRNA (adenosine(37)-N6)-threonylcarbamoyltransferase complex transferase subunit TsaD [bacterium (Candidatus Blackallbacteria) CG18_big_fil_WC_8_21_14_2_50_49_26]PIW16560.1 MAG: tRNA (adenosine(37)-N6)-threonylcarbamoyltransferase complex transferase subunit TsaD [bacterium (Candidatus Blackallbacteria) CG17_big_fil_post_rev_8_21_14_2_50_48_46]PIW46068.1 MAG: tRNA (adenosine(37)-N6)-threonylcarbamoyltransferase complex transferase subunit TsaD [bacterium (Candidatus Blackallbacteria) CG13